MIDFLDYLLHKPLHLVSMGFAVTAIVISTLLLTGVIE